MREGGSVYVCVCVSVCLCLCECECVCVSVCVCMCVWLSERYISDGQDTCPWCFGLNSEQGLVFEAGTVYQPEVHTFTPPRIPPEFKSVFTDREREDRHIQTQRQTDRRAGRQTERQTHTHTQTQTHTPSWGMRREHS